MRTTQQRKPAPTHVRKIATQRPWTPKEVTKLRTAIAEGLSYDQCRKRLPGRTRNMIIGKCYRLGLREPMSAEEHRFRVAQHVRAASFATRLRGGFVVVATTAEIIAFPKGGTMVALENLKDGHHCKWPIGDPKRPNFGFCGCTPVAGSPYCADHKRIAFEPAIAIELPLAA